MSRPAHTPRTPSRLRLAAVVLTALGACSVHFGGGHGWHGVRGSGVATTVEHQLPAFTAIETSGAVDLVGCADVVFKGAPDIQDPGCLTKRFDLDCDGFSTALDVAVMIDHLFAGGDPPCDPCAP